MKSSARSVQLLSEALAPKPALPENNEVPLELDCEELVLGMEASGASSEVFFSLISKKAGRLKLPHLPAASSKRLKKDDLMITTHEHLCLEHVEDVELVARGHNPDSFLVLAAPQMACGISSAVAAFSLCQSDLATVTASLQIWVRKGLHYTVGSIADSSSVLADLVHSKAFPNLQKLVVQSNREEDLVALTALERRGMVTCTDRNEHFSRWQFTAHGASSLKLAHLVGDPELIFNPITNFSQEHLMQATAWELMHSLESQGFALRIMPQRNSKDQMLPHKPDAPNRSCYFRTRLADSAAQRLYMIALLLSQHLFEKGYEEIHHLQPDKYYSAMLQGHVAPAPIAIRKARASGSQPGVQDPANGMSVDVEEYSSSHIYSGMALSLPGCVVVCPRFWQYII